MPRQEGGRLVSDDGRWWWDGTGWQPITAAAPVTGPLARSPRPGLATAALVLGVLAMFLWLLPILGLPIAVAAIVCGRLGRFTPLALGRSRWGFILGLVGLGLSLINALVGAILSVSQAR